MMSRSSRSCSLVSGMTASIPTIRAGRCGLRHDNNRLPDTFARIRKPLVGLRLIFLRVYRLQERLTYPVMWRDHEDTWNFPVAYGHSIAGAYRLQRVNWGAPPAANTCNVSHADFNRNSWRKHAGAIA